MYCQGAMFPSAVSLNAALLHNTIVVHLLMAGKWVITALNCHQCCHSTSCLPTLVESSYIWHVAIEQHQVAQLKKFLQRLRKKWPKSFSTDLSAAGWTSGLTGVKYQNSENRAYLEQNQLRLAMLRGNDNFCSSKMGIHSWTNSDCQPWSDWWRWNTVHDQ